MSDSSARHLTFGRDTCASCSARNRGLCGQNSDLEIQLFSAIKGSRRSVPANRDLYRQGDRFDEYLIVLEGWVATRVMLKAGSWRIPDFALPGSLLGVQPYASVAMNHSAITLTPVTVCPLPRNRLDALARRNGAIGLRLAHLAACREARLLSHFANIAGRAARERVAHLLVELFYRGQRRLPSKPGDTAMIPLTLAQIGEALNLTDVHVSRTLAILRDQGIASFFRHRLEVLAPDTMLRAAGFDTDSAAFFDDAIVPSEVAPSALHAG
jgi:CRP-like cAMP-binding protein